MSDFTLLHQSQNEFGQLMVLDSKTTRILAFGDNDEQSKLLKLSPHIPQHTYVQAMLLVLLFCQPKSAIVLGLGGGGLIHALRHFDSGIKLTGVEINPDVIEVAKRYFQLPIGKKLKLINQDASDFLAEGSHKRVDLIFADLYNFDGADSAQHSKTFIEQSAALLKSDGFLVINGWKEQKFDDSLLLYLQQEFVDIRACLTGAGNWVVIAAKQKHAVTQSAMKAKAMELSQRLEFQLTRSLTRFEHWE